MSRFEELAAQPGSTIVTAEMPIIDSGGFEAVQRHLDRLMPLVDAINATDNAAAHAHASNVAMAVAMARLGAEPVLQVVCRDKNRLALEADIVGASMFGVENICCLTGDDVTAGDEPEARRVFDLDGPQLVRLATTLAGGSYLSGRPLNPAPHLFVGAVENAGAPPFAYRAARAAKKVRAGARFFQLQICFHPDRLADFMAECVRLGLTTQAVFLPTVCLVRGARALRFMNQHVPGIDVPQDTVRRVESAADPREEAYQVVLEQARHALSVPGVRGLHITDFRHDDSVGRLVSDLGLDHRHDKEHHAHGPELAVQDGHDRPGPAVLHHRGADQPDRTQEVPGAAAGG
jgi:methylenetetrahydrofolate reductase (NADPH)